MLGRLPAKKRGLALSTAVAALLTANAALAQQAPAQPAPEAAAQSARIEALKGRAIEGVEARKKLAQVINDTVFSFGELGYQEFETSKYLTSVLEKNGFQREGHLRGYFKLRGRRIDNYLFALLRDDYENGRPQR